jgi:hypothetical protein
MSKQCCLLAFLKRRRLLLAAVALLTLLSFLLCGPAAPTGCAQIATSKGTGASRSRSIKGRVVDETGQPLPGASVTLIPAAGNSDSGSQWQTVRTEEDGGFSFYAVADKPYTVTVLGFEDSAPGQYHLPGEDVTIRVVKGGIITGRVTSLDGQPLVGAQVVAKCIARGGGKPLPSSPFSYELLRSRTTDDRGIYRFWGLQPGVYIVAAGARAFGVRSGLTLYDDDSPTYYPSSTLASATHLEVNSGQELTGIDITYRGYAGHVVSGTMTGNSPPSYLQAFLFTLSGDYMDSVSLPSAESSAPFAFSRVSDGEYLLIAARESGNGIIAISPPRAVTVKGADVTGIDLKPLPIGSLSGRIRLDIDPKLDCKVKPNNSLAETVLSLKRQGAPGENYPRFSSELSYAASPDASGQFAMKRVPAGDYRMEFWLPNEDWYVSAMALGSGSQQQDIGSRGIFLSQGQTISSLNVVIKTSAAGLSGRIVPASAGTVLPAGLRVFLQPAQPGRADERLRYSETEAASDGSFKFKNLAPGSYKIAVHTLQEIDSTQPPAHPVRGQTIPLQRAGAEALTIELHPCERRTDYRLKYPQSSPLRR